MGEWVDATFPLAALAGARMGRREGRVYVAYRHSR